MLTDDELDSGCLVMARFFVTDRASRANLLSAAEQSVTTSNSTFVLTRLADRIVCHMAIWVNETFGA